MPRPEVDVTLLRVVTPGEKSAVMRSRSLSASRPRCAAELCTACQALQGLLGRLVAQGRQALDHLGHRQPTAELVAQAIQLLVGKLDHLAGPVTEEQAQRLVEVAPALDERPDGGRHVDAAVLVELVL